MPFAKLISLLVSYVQFCLYYRRLKWRSLHKRKPTLDYFSVTPTYKLIRCSGNVFTYIILKEKKNDLNGTRTVVFWYCSIPLLPFALCCNHCSIFSNFTDNWMRTQKENIFMLATTYVLHRTKLFKPKFKLVLFRLQVFKLKFNNTFIYWHY